MTGFRAEGINPASRPKGEGKIEMVREMCTSNEFGWRARVGLLVPSPNWVVESWFNRVAPEGVAFHVSRMNLGKISPDAVNDMIAEGFRAIREVSSARVDLIAECCTVSTLIKGLEFEENMIRDFEDAAGGTPVITATSSILRAFGQLGLKKIVIAHPYPDEFDKWEIKYFSDSGIEVLASKGMGIADVVELAKPSPEEIYRFARSAWMPEADGLFISCLNFRAQGAIQALENDLGKPVVTSCQATLWNILRTVGVKEKIPGYGQLLSVF